MDDGLWINTSQKIRVGELEVMLYLLLTEPAAILTTSVSNMLTLFLTLWDSFAKIWSAKGLSYFSVVENIK